VFQHDDQHDNADDLLLEHHAQAVAVLVAVVASH
jgi:hypothetical protein